jgi:hypothetical protein
MHELDVARVALIEVASEAMAFRLREKVSNGASGFVAAMHEAFVTGDPGTTCRFATLRRREAVSDIETQLFAAVPGEVVGPVRTGASYVLGCLLDASNRAIPPPRTQPQSKCFSMSGSGPAAARQR